MKHELYFKNFEKNKTIDGKERVMFHQPTQPFKQIKYINNVITVVLYSGKVLTKSQATNTLYNKCLETSSIEDLFNLFSLNNKSLQSVFSEQIFLENTHIQKNFLLKFDLFTTSHRGFLKFNDIYLADNLISWFYKEFMFVEKFNITLEEIIDHYPEIVSILNFYKFFTANNLNFSTKKLFDGRELSEFVSSKSGLLLGFRNVVYKEEDSYQEIVSNAYCKIKFVLDKSPSEFNLVLKNNTYSVSNLTSDDKDSVGNVQDLFNELKTKGSVYTDFWSNSINFKLGEAIKKESLKFSTVPKKFVGLENRVMLLLINPLNIISLEDDGRTLEYIPLMSVFPGEVETIVSELMCKYLYLDEFYENAVDDIIVEEPKEPVKINKSNVQAKLNKLNSKINKRIKPL